MDFESEQYLTYNEYNELGGTLDIMPFNLLELEARINIDRETQRRLVGEKNIPIEVKSCMFKLVEGMAFDGTYKNGSSSDKEKYINEIIYNNLVSVIFNGVHLMYRGV